MRQILYSRPLLFLGLLAALSVLWIAEQVERAHWRKYGKLQMGMTDGYHTMVNGRCYDR